MDKENQNQNLMEQTLDFLKNLYLQNKEEADRALKKFEERQFYKQANERYKDVVDIKEVSDGGLDSY